MTDLLLIFIDFYFLMILVVCYINCSVCQTFTSSDNCPGLYFFKDESDGWVAIGLGLGFRFGVIVSIRVMI